MKFAPISDRLSGLGAAKWAVHVEALRRQNAGESITMLSIGEPDFLAPGSARVLQRNANPSKLNLERFRASQKRLVADLLYTKRFNGLHLTDLQIRKTARLALGTWTSLLVATGAIVLGFTIGGSLGYQPTKELTTYFGVLAHHRSWRRLRGFFEALLRCRIRYYYRPCARFFDAALPGNRRTQPR